MWIVANWREMESVVAEQQSHGMFHVVSILRRFVIGKREFSVVEFVISDAIFKDCARIPDVINVLAEPLV